MKTGAVITCALVVMAFGATGCATIVEGRHQEIFVNVTPSNARCIAYRKGKAVGEMNSASHLLVVTKSRNDLVLSCSAPGYRSKDVRFESTASAWGVVGALTLDLGITDYSTGALNKYDGTMTITLER